MIAVHPFHDAASGTFSYLLSDSAQRVAAVIDPVLDYCPASGTQRTAAVEGIIERIERESLKLEWILETHVHADHLSAARFLRSRLGGVVAIGARVRETRCHFARRFNWDADRDAPAGAFDRLLHEGDRLTLGEAVIEVLETPGHTPESLSFHCAGELFVGDTLFMPGAGTARSDFPGGDAGELYDSIGRILSFPAETRLRLCHDYGTPQRRSRCGCTTVAAQAGNEFLAAAPDRQSFALARRLRDQGLAAPRLLYPSLQFNLRGGRTPPPEANGERYFKIPLQLAPELRALPL